MKRQRTRRKSYLLRPRTRGQAMAEMVMLTFLLVVFGSLLTYFFPESLNALQIYMDSFYYVLSMPFP